MNILTTPAISQHVLGLKNIFYLDSEEILEKQ